VSADGKRVLTRYWPLVAALAVQTLVVAAAPSQGPRQADDSASTSSWEASGDGTMAERDPEAAAAADGPQSGGAVSTGPVRTTLEAGSPSAGVQSRAGDAVAGDTGHCVAGRQFDPAIYFWAPPCAPKFAGADNGGATYQGVSATEIKAVVYRGKPNPAVDALLNAAGANPDDRWVSDLMRKANDFINASFELYGRRLTLEEVRGRCDTVPPDYVCLRGEMRDIVREKKPFAVIWPTILASAAFDELSAMKVLNIGGSHFRNNPFSVQRRPYHWDVQIAGDTAARAVGEWYCNRLHGRKASFAGATGPDPQTQNPPNNDIRGKARVLGVISTDDPENLHTIRQVLAPELRKCGASIAHEFYYAQDISRAEEQRRLALAKMREAPESTTIMCFCDAVAALFLYRTAQEQAYFPEHIVSGMGGMDSDVAGQSYDSASSLCGGCHQVENAFGLRSLPMFERFDDNAATRLYKRMNGGLSIDWSKFVTAQNDINYYFLLGSLLQGAGPNLTPSAVERGGFSAGLRGGFSDLNDPRWNRRGFAPGHWAWFRDLDQVYWSPTAVSPFNGKRGTWLQLDGRRFEPGQFPGGDPALPGKPR
jgi:hypothetical protein